MTRQMRNGKYRNGLILANGGCLTHHHAICLSSEPREVGSTYPPRNPLPEHLESSTAPVIDEQADGEAIIEVSSTRPRNNPSLTPSLDLHGRI